MGKRYLGLLAALFVVTAVIFGWSSPASKTKPAVSSIPLSELLGSDNQGFARVDASRRFRFPDDHGAHPDFRTELWYFTGNLASEQGPRFGFQLTIFRLALASERPEHVSAWATNQIYRAHFALTDIDDRRIQAFERFSRQALGLSGADSDPVRVWLENWTISAAGEDLESTRFDLRVAAGDIDLALQLRTVKPVSLPEGGGVVAGGSGAAFHSYLLSRMGVRGTLRLGDTRLAVTGSAWLDRAWGAVPVSRGQVALNRFALQLDDGRELMCFQLHRRDGTGTPVTTGLLIESDGSVLRLGRRDMSLETLDYWASPRDGARYPARWRLRIPGEQIDMDISPSVADQELNLSTRYWSGTVTLAGEAAGQRLSGSGHVELTGYAEGALQL